MNYTTKYQKYQKYLKILKDIKLVVDMNPLNIAGCEMSLSIIENKIKEAKQLKGIK